MTEIGAGAHLGVTVFGVGGAGGNAVAALLQRPDCGMKIVCANTDVQALQTVPVAHRLQLGRRLTAGLGAGARPEIGRAAAEEALPEIEAALAGSTLCFIAAGLGGGTGTGAAPVIARAARARGILTIGVATKPFAFEGKRRARTAETGAADLAASVDVMVSVCNQKLFGVIGPDTTLRAALDLSDSILGESATDFALLLGDPALKRVGLSDLRTLLAASGHAVIGYGEAGRSPERAVAAARAALCNPLLEGAPASAPRLLVTVTGGPDLGLFEVEEAISFLRAGTAAETELVWGAAIDPALAGRIRVGIVAAGIPAPGAALATAAPYRLAARQPIVATPPEPVRQAPARERPVAPEPPQFVLALEPAIAPPAAPIEQRVLTVVPRSAVRPSLADRLYRAARAAKRRVQPRANSVPAPDTAKAPGAFQLLKAFDPPPRASLHAIGPFAAITRRTVILT